MDVLDPPTDATAALLASRTDPEAFGVVFDAHFGALHGYLRRRLGEPLGEELAAETFTRAFDQRTRFDPQRSGVRPWLHGIAANLVRDHARAEARRLRAYARAARRDEDRGGDEGDALGRLAAAAAAPELSAALAALRAPERDVLLLVAWAELSYDEVAAALGVPVGTVRSRLHRARAHVRDHLDLPEAPA